MGLSLTSEEGVRTTAIGQVARQQTNTGRAGVQPPGATFGIDMPIIDPGNPGNSYLIYKLLSGGEPPGASQTSGTEAAIHAPLTSDETARLRNLIVGLPMPVGAAALSFDDAEGLRAGIAHGANRDCR